MATIYAETGQISYFNPGAQIGRKSNSQIEYLKPLVLPKTAERKIEELAANNPVEVFIEGNKTTNEV